MTDIAALALGIEAIAALPGDECEHKRAAIVRLLAMRDRLLGLDTDDAPNGGDAARVDAALVRS